MVNYNFLNLTPIEFEEIARDILQVREGIDFESFAVGKDGGIDFRYKRGDINVILQAKRYKDYKELTRVLFKEEIVKVRRLKPTRYILILSIDLTPPQKQEILDVFKGYVLTEIDLLGVRDLNNLLSQPKYASVRKTHYKLWLTGTDALQDIIEQITYRKEFNLAKAELDVVKKASKYYVQNKSFPEALDNIEEKRMVLISGTPGSGKTTLAHALISYYISKEGFTELVYITEGAGQAWSMLKEDCKQIFFFDDFLGDISFERLQRKEDKLLSKFIENINNSAEKILILTTREYVLRQAQQQHPELKTDLYQLSMCYVEPGSYTEYIRAKILYNHLYFSNLHPKQILLLAEKENYERVIDHAHYNPRLIDNYIKFSANSEALNEYRFVRDFIKYLDHPRAFWGDIYDKLSSEAQLLLITLFGLNDPVYLDHLEQAYHKMASSYLKKFNSIIISPVTFRNILRELSDTFIRIDLKSEFLNSYIVRFQNPSIKDFLLEYLRSNNDLIEIIIHGASFLNQLIFAFDTREKEIRDHDSFDDEPFYGKKIVLKDKLRLLFIDKFISEFDTLSLSTINASEFTDQKTLYHSAEDLLTFKLLEMNSLFGMQNEAVRCFIINKFHQIITTYENKMQNGGGKILTKDAMLYFPNIVKIVKPFVSIDPDQLLNYCYNSITFTSEFLDLHKLGEIYPAAFKKLLKKIGKSIQTKIKETIIDDINYFEEEDQGEETDMLLDWEYPEVFKKFGLEITEKFTKKIYALKSSYREPWSKEDHREWKAKNQHRHEEHKNEEKDIANLFGSLRAIYSADLFQSDKDLFSFLKEQIPQYSTSIINKIKKNRYSDIRPFLHDKLSVRIILEYYKLPSSSKEEGSSFWRGISQVIYMQLPLECKLTVPALEEALSMLAFNLLISGESEFTQKSLRKMEAVASDYIEQLDVLSPIILKSNKWYRFINIEFQVYLSALHIKNLTSCDHKSFYNNQVTDLDNNFLHEAPGLLALLFEIDKTALIKYYIIPLLENFISQLDFSNNKLLILSYFKLTNFHIDLELTKDGFLTESSFGSSCYYEEDLIDLLGIEMNFYTADKYFLREYITDQDFEAKKEIYTELFTYLKSNFARETNGTIAINMYLELLKPRFYELLKLLGIEDQVNREVFYLTNKIDELRLFNE